MRGGDRNQRWAEQVSGAWRPRWAVLAVILNISSYATAAHKPLLALTFATLSGAYTCLVVLNWKGAADRLYDAAAARSPVQGPIAPRASTVLTWRWIAGLLTATALVSAGVAVSHL